MSDLLLAGLGTRGQSVFLPDMTNIYQSESTARFARMGKSSNHSKGEMSGDGGLTFLRTASDCFWHDMGEESGAKTGTPVASALSVRSPIAKGDQANAKKTFRLDGV